MCPSTLPNPTTSTAYRMRANTANSLVSELDGRRRAAYIVPAPELSTPLTLEAGRVVRAAESWTIAVPSWCPHAAMVRSLQSPLTMAPHARRAEQRQEDVGHASCGRPRCQRSPRCVDGVVLSCKSTSRKGLEVIGSVPVKHSPTWHKNAFTRLRLDVQTLFKTEQPCSYQCSALRVSYDLLTGLNRVICGAIQHERKACPRLRRSQCRSALLKVIDSS
jgi:hypothetical protein